MQDPIDYRKQNKNLKDLEPICSIINLLIEYGVKVFHIASIESKTRKEIADANVVILLLYLHILEMLDGIYILLSKCATTAAILQLRTLFETFLYLKWITKEDSINKALAYSLYDMLDRVNLYNSYIDDTKQGKELAAIIKNDEIHFSALT